MSVVAAVFNFIFLVFHAGCPCVSSVCGTLILAGAHSGFIYSERAPAQPLVKHNSLNVMCDSFCVTKHALVADDGHK